MTKTVAGVLDSHSRIDHCFKGEIRNCVYTCIYPLTFCCSTMKNWNQAWSSFYFLVKICNARKKSEFVIYSLLFTPVLVRNQILEKMAKSPLQIL